MWPCCFPLSAERAGVRDPTLGTPFPLSLRRIYPSSSSHKARSFDVWREQAPPSFCYALRFSHYGSHLKRLKEPHALIARFLDRASRLRECLSPILVQLLSHWTPEPARLAGFLKAAPSIYCWAIELRDPRWLCDEVYAILRSAAAALCLHDRIAGHPRCLTNDAYGYAVQNAADLRRYIMETRS
jgi:uncharacterized protein YecE (DUF72 family)